MVRRVWLVLVVGLLTSLIACAETTDEQGGGGDMALGWDPEFTDAWGPAIGTKTPELAVKATDGSSKTLKELSGTSGLLVFFVRSTNW